MILPRRRILHQAASVATLLAVPHIARAQTYPARPVHLLVGYPPGGPVDIAARLIGGYLSERLGQTFVIENRAGTGSNLATEAVVRAQPDGYTLLATAPPNIINATLYPNLSFNFIRDIAPVAGLVRVPNVMEVNPSFPAKTVPEFIIYAKSNPGKINFASAGIGASQHVAAELFKFMTGVAMQHVPYRGAAPALADLMAGQVQVMFDPITSSIGYIRAGRLRPLAVTTATRSDALPDAPTVRDFVPGCEVSALYGIGAPKDTSVEIIGRLNEAINAGLLDPTIKGRFADLGATVLTGSPADFGKLIGDETEKWAKVIRAANIKAE
jgi:tripartite-type tricarboxylate transporter receptor subunit TctC